MQNGIVVHRLGVDPWEQVEAAHAEGKYVFYELEATRRERLAAWWEERDFLWLDSSSIVARLLRPFLIVAFVIVWPAVCAILMAAGLILSPFLLARGAWRWLRPEPTL